MTDRVSHLFVVLEHDTREDDVTVLTDAIRQLRGVLSVTTGTPHDLDSYIALKRAKRELKQKMWDLLTEQD